MTNPRRAAASIAAGLTLIGATGAAVAAERPDRAEQAESPAVVAFPAAKWSSDRPAPTARVRLYEDATVTVRVPRRIGGDGERHVIENGD